MGALHSFCVMIGCQEARNEVRTMPSSVVHLQCSLLHQYPSIRVYARMQSRLLLLLLLLLGQSDDALEHRVLGVDDAARRRSD